MNVRPATIADIDRCERLDCSYTTQHVWQMDETISAESISVGFRRIRVPRKMELFDPRSKDDLFEVWKRSRCFLVADEQGVVLGYLSMVVRRRTWQGWVEHLSVHRPYRRQGVARLLLAGAERWARGSELTGVTAVVQSKNDPAISMLPKLGYAFRGFIDDYFENGDLGLLYSLRL